MEIPVASDGRMHIALRAVWCHRPLGPSMGSQPKALPFLLLPEGWGRGCPVHMEPGWQLVFQSGGAGSGVRKAQKYGRFLCQVESGALRQQESPGLRTKEGLTGLLKNKG